MGRLFRQFSFPGGVPSHVAPETPGSIHEGGELGYSLTHAHGAAFDNPDLVVACIVGDGEAETFLGAAIDEQRNQAASSDADITAPGAAVRTLVITAREDIEIARQVRTVLRGPSANPVAEPITRSRARG